jgi:YidC/Oxa1 family membrane protein insertase
MLGELWTNILVNPIFNVTMLMYKLSGSLGISIILLTLFIRALLIPVMIPSLKAIKKQRDIQPELKKLKEKYKYDKKKQAEMQMVLFKKHGINPASGCLTQIVMMVVLFALYGVIRKFTYGASITELNSHIFVDFLKLSADSTIATKFLYMDLAKQDPLFILAILAGLFQLVSSKMTMPYVEAGEKAAKNTPDKNDDIAYNMQQQMLYTMPIMNFIIGLTLPSGVVLYIVTTTIFSIVQTYFVSGWGGMQPYINKIRTWTNKKK